MLSHASLLNSPEKLVWTYHSTSRYTLKAGYLNVAFDSLHAQQPWRGKWFGRKSVLQILIFWVEYDQEQSIDLGKPLETFFIGLRKICWVPFRGKINCPHFCLLTLFKFSLVRNGSDSAAESYLGRRKYWILSIELVFRTYSKEI